MAVLKHYTDISPEPVISSGAKNAYKRLLIGSTDGTPLFSLRMFEIENKGNTPFHTHDFEHVIYVVQGTASIKTAEAEHRAPAGTAAFIPPGERHTVINPGEGTLRFLCAVPREYE